MADLTVSEKAYQIIDKLQEELQERTKVTLDLEKSAHQNSLKLVEHENTITKLGRDVSKLQKTVDAELRRRRYAEQMICLRKDCDIRIPAIGTYVPPIETDEKDEDITE
jgi:septal ring factor EnvC (AmiA/AmiB activator)